MKRDPREVCREIAIDMEQDMNALDGQPFTGSTVAKQFGNHAAAIVALAKIVETMLLEWERKAMTDAPKPTPAPQEERLPLCRPNEGQPWIECVWLKCNHDASVIPHLWVTPAALHPASGINKCNAHVSGGPNATEHPGWTDRVSAPSSQEERWTLCRDNGPIDNKWHECNLMRGGSCGCPEAFVVVPAALLDAERERATRLQDENFTDLLDQMDEAWGSANMVGRVEINAFIETRRIHRPTRSLRDRLAAAEKEREDLLSYASEIAHGITHWTGCLGPADPAGELCERCLHEAAEKERDAERKQYDEAVQDCTELVKERDEARATVERVRGADIGTTACYCKGRLRAALAGKEEK